MKRTSERNVIYTVEDASMQPRFEVGDCVEVDLEAEINDGDIVVAVIEDGRTILRKMKNDREGIYIFTPLNNDYEPIISTRPIIVGRAVRLYRSFDGHTPFIAERESNIAGQVPCFDACLASEDANEREGE